MVNTVAFTLFAGLAAVANAYTKADTSVNPNGNNITTPATGGSVNAGANFDITWIPTSQGTVTIYLCKGPSTNCVNQDVPLADKVANSGKFSWAVSKSLEQSTTTGQGYGIQLIDDADTKIYQYSGQFGIINKDVTSASSSASSSASATGSSTGSASKSASASASSTANSTVTATTTASSKATITGNATGGANSTVIQPTGSLTVPSSLRTTATGSHTGSSSATGTARPTGAAGAVQVGVGALVGGVLAALAL